MLTAVKNGDFSARLPADWTGINGKIADTFNDIVGMNDRLEREVHRVATVVGKEGKIGHRLNLGRVEGAWAQKAEDINSLVTDLAAPTREMARVIGAVAKGDLSQTVSLEVEGRPLQGEFLRAGKAVNSMVEQLSAFTSEVTRVAREVGTEGKLGGQAQIKGVAGTWKDLTESVNSMASNLTAQVRNIADVTISVASGDLSKKITVDVRGEFLQLKDAINTMVEQLRGFASEVTRVAREVGTEGKLGGQAVVPGVAGVWKDLTDNVNGMAANLTAQVRNIADVTTAVARGDLARKITVDAKGEILELKNTVNIMVDQLNSFASEVTRVAREVGTDGKLGGQAEVRGVGGTWKDLTDNVNSMAANLTAQVRNIAEVTTAVANGDLNRKITVDARGEILELKNTINTMVDQLNSFASEVTRVAREVGTDGKLGGQGDVRGVAGTWKDLTDSVNGMAANLTSQVRNIAEVTTAVANGDLARKITVDARGEILELKNTINTMVDRLNSFASEVTRVAREVGTEGKLGGQGQVPGVAGTWKDLTDSVNGMAANLTSQVRNIAEVTTAVAKGDLSKKITVDARGEILELKNTVNIMVDQLNAFASEVTRVAREVGTEGRLGGQADVKGVGGTWKDLTDNVNSMAANLTAQVRNIADVTTAVAKGDLTRKITVDARGEILELKNTVNIMVDQLNSFASEVSRVAREVGTEGKLGGQAEVKGVAGTWKDLTDNVNGMAANLTNQVRNIADVTTAVAKGDLTRKITVDARGEILQLKNTINTMVDQLSSFADEVTRVAREVGTEGKLGGQAQVPGVAGTWKDLTDSVNGMAANLTNQVRNIAEVTTSVANGELARKITVDARGEILELKNTINIMVDRLNSFAAEVTRVAREVGTEGKLGGQGQVPGVAGVWKDLTDSVNGMAANLTSQVRNIATVTTAVANGDLTRKITVDAKGEILELKDTINTMVDQLNSFASEVTRVAREVGTEGKLGGQGQVSGVAGTWKDLTDSVNGMAANLTNQVRNIAEVATAIANGELARKITVDAKGEILELKNTLNLTVDRLNSFASEVTRVAREVGTEGKLGGQAQVPGAAGTWKDLTDNVNRLAANLTTQVRAIAEVSTAVTQGDLSRSITVDAAGEVALLKDNVNEMIRNLKSTTTKNAEQDWLKTNLATFTRKLQGQRDLQQVCKMTLSELAPLVQAQQGVFYIHEAAHDETYLKLLASYAYRERKQPSNEFKAGEGLIGQVLIEKERVLITDVPNDYIKIGSGLGESKPLNLVVLPVLFEGGVKAVIELASFQRFSDIHLTFLDQLMESLGIVVNTIQANMRTEELLKQSQSLTNELQSQQAELTEKNKRLEEQARSLQASEELLKKQQETLQNTNDELQEKAQLLSQQKTEVEQKNAEVETARMALQSKAEELALTSKYKSEFLANMSHELRTPLNSLLILSKILQDNTDNNLTEKQVEHARTIHTSGSDLLELINEILDLSKIESGTMAVDVSDVGFEALREFTDRTFRHVAETKKLDFEIKTDPNMPRSLRTDGKRVQQVLKNLLSNAFKFTDRGGVELTIRPAIEGWGDGQPRLDQARTVIAFDVRDTGIGIPKEKQRIIFEAFQQADAGTARKYGGTGLGLSISREIAWMLGGAIRVVSEPGSGSTFTLFLPISYTPPHKTAGSARAAATTAPVRRIQPPAVAETGPALEIIEYDDDRNDLAPGDQVLLIVDDDPGFSNDLMRRAHTQGFKCITARGVETGADGVREYAPAAIVLDLRLPDGNGWALLDHWKSDPATRHIPVQIISVDLDEERTLRLGALGCLQKPVPAEALDAALARLQEFLSRRIKQLLVVEDDETQRQSILELIGGSDVQITGVGTAEAAKQALAERRFDCLVVDLRLPDLPGAELIGQIKRMPNMATLPIIVYTGKELTESEDAELRRMSEAVIIKDVKSPERLLDETALFLHRVQARLPERQRRLIEKVRQSDPSLAGKKVLVVDDDLRNIFAITTALQRYKMQVIFAESGQQALDLLSATPDLDAVLMDVMMPEMDGMECMRRIRANPVFANLPILAVTAKAMKGDREKCLEAGANDYITKPVDMDRLRSLLRVYLSEPRVKGQCQGADEQH